MTNLVEEIVSKLSDQQKRAILLFGETKNIYRYHDNGGLYGEPFLWCSNRFDPESAPSNVLDSMGFFGSSLGYKLLQWYPSEYSGDYFFLTDLGKEVLMFLKTETSIQGYIKRVKMNSRPPGGLRL